MLPPGSDIVSSIAFATGWIPVFGTALESYLKKHYDKYMHGGDMRYLSNCKPDCYDNVKLLFSVSWFYRTKAWFLKGAAFKEPLADHTMKTYRKKLMIIARNRNLTSATQSSSEMH